VRSQFVLVTELEASLLTSQKALLTRNVARLEECTREQAYLRSELQVFASANGGAQANGPRGQNQDQEDENEAAALRAAHARVLHLARVQLVLLDRARQSLKIISHLVAGYEAGYAPLLREREVARQRAARPGEEPRCRV